MNPPSVTMKCYPDFNLEDFYKKNFLVESGVGLTPEMVKAYDTLAASCPSKPANEMWYISQ
jgi:hypothetical protein